MAGGTVPTANVSALYNNTTPGVTADPAAVDNAVQDVISTINNNWTDFMTHLTQAELGHPDGSVTTRKVADGAIITIKLVDGAVVTAKIADLNITTGKIADNAIVTVKLADGAVLTAKIADGAVTSVKIADGTITGAKMADGTITTAKLVDSIITAAKILDGTITTQKYADGSVTGQKIANGAINPQHIDPNFLTQAGQLATQIEFDKRAVNVHKFGVKGDGTDESAKFQSAADSLKPGGGKLYIPAGSYVGHFTMASNVTVQGAGRGVTTLKLPNGANTAVIRNEHIGDTEYGTDKNIRVLDLTIDGNYQNQTFIATVGGVSTVIRAGDVSVVGGKTMYAGQEITIGFYEIISGVYFKGVDYADVVDCEFKNCFQSHVWYNFSRWGSISRNICDTTFYHSGLSVSGDNTRSGEVFIEENIINNSALDGINAVERDLKILNNKIYNSGWNLVDNHLVASGIYCSWTSKDLVIMGNTIDGASGLGIEGKQITGNTIIGNNISNCGLGGIWLYNNADHNRIIGNKVKNTCQTALAGSNYGGIGVGGFTGDPTKYSKHNIVLGNECWDDQATKTQQYGFVFINADYTFAANNDAHDNLVGNYLTNLNANGSIKIPGSDGFLKSFLQVDLQAQSGYSGRHTMELLGSSDNSLVEIYSNKPRVSFVDGPGNALTVVHAWPVGTPLQRPVNAVNGQPYYDQGLNIPIWFNNGNWVDRSGAKVWCPNTAYNVNDIVTTGKNMYLCTVAGTTGTVVPTHTSGTATDGTVTWAYYTGVLKADLRGQTGFNGRHALELYGSTDNGLVEIYSNKPQISVVDGGGAPLIVVHAWQSGSATVRPSNAVNAQPYYDTDLNKPLWYRSSSLTWRDANGQIAWTPNHAYAVNDQVVTGNNVYKCTVAGTTGTVVPNHTTGTATDGTVTWQWVKSII